MLNFTVSSHNRPAYILGALTAFLLSLIILTIIFYFILGGLFIVSSALLIILVSSAGFALKRWLS